MLSFIYTLCSLHCQFNNNDFSYISDNITVYWENVKKELNKQKKSQIELAENIGLSIGTLRNKINLNTLPTFETAIKISEFLNCSVEYLLFGSESNAFSNEEISLIKDYRILTPIQKQIIKMLFETFKSVISSTHD